MFENFANALLLEYLYRKRCQIEQRDPELNGQIARRVFLYRLKNVFDQHDERERACG